jgi:hypothetical protein
MTKQLLPALSLLAAAAVLLSGCGAGLTSTATQSGEAAVAGAPLRGSLHGGQQAVSGATMQLYAANSSGYGLAATPLITSTIISNPSGGFSITGGYTCPTTATQVYLTATGGNPGLTQNNPNLMMMAALGPCGTLATNASTTFIQLNEVTTVGSVYALSGFMTGATKMSTSANNTNGLSMAFADVNQIVNNATGFASGPALPAGATLPVSEINTLANILSACINSTGGTAGDSSNCGKLFTAATPAGGPAPTDTLTAALNIVQNPGSNVAALYALSTANPPFQPALAAAPNDFTLAVNYSTGSFSTPSGLAIDATGNVWVTNSASNTVTELTHAGTPVSGSPFVSAATAPSSIAIDTAGGAWIAGKGSNTLVHLTAAGVASATAANGGLNAPTSVAIDANGNVWATNSGANTVSEFTPAGVAVSATGFAGSATSRPVGVIISAH